MPTALAHIPFNDTSHCVQMVATDMLPRGASWWQGPRTHRWAPWGARGHRAKGREEKEKEKGKNGYFEEMPVKAAFPVMQEGLSSQSLQLYSWTLWTGPGQQHSALMQQLFTPNNEADGLGSKPLFPRITHNLTSQYYILFQNSHPPSHAITDFSHTANHLPRTPSKTPWMCQGGKNPTIIRRLKIVRI